MFDSSRCALAGLSALVIASIQVHVSARQLEVGTEYLLRAFRFLDVAYPELRDEAKFLQFSGAVFDDPPWAREFGIRIGDSRADARREVRTRVDAQNVFFEARFDFDTLGLRRYAAGGRFVHDPENATFCHALKDHRMWSDRDIAMELTRRGADYGPEKKTEARAHVPSTDFMLAMVGTEPLMLSALEFVIPDQRERESPHEFRCVNWQATYKTLPGGRGLEYIVEIEPFGGRLRTIRRDPEY